MRAPWSLALALTMFLTAASVTAAAEPDGRTPESAIPLTTATPEWGQLVGNPGGAFVYYVVDYPGDSSDVIIDSQFTPGDVFTADGFGLTIYQGGGMLGKVVGLGGENPGENSLTVFSDRKGPLVVQVSNYRAREIFYRLTLSGTAFPPAPDFETADHAH
jgi:hypothetical protein